MKLITTKHTHNSDDFHYLVDNEKIYSRLYAMQKAQSLSDKTNSVWGNIKFITPIEVTGTEPDFSIDDLYIERARRLRKKYDYLRIWLSGGADSSHVAALFYQAGVMPDELAYFNTITGDFSSLGTPDIEYGLKPYLSTYKEWWPGVKIQSYDIFPEDYLWYATNALEHFIAHKYLAVEGVSLHQAYEVHPRLLEHDLKCRAANIYSGPDFVIGNDDNGWYYRFNDLNTNMALLNPFQEYFFSSNDFPELHLKIAYIIKRYCSKHLIEDVSNVKNEWPVSLSNIPELEFRPGFRRQYDDKFYKKLGVESLSFGAGHGYKSLKLNQDFLRTKIGHKAYMNILWYYKELNDKNPGWFNNNDIINGWIGMRSKKIYF